MKYEYKIVEARTPKIAEEVMNTMGNDGWRVSSVVYWGNVRTLLIITFEREK